MGNLNKVTYTDHQTVITAANLNDIQDSVIANTSYSTCTTAANTAAKTASLTDFVLTTGSCIRVKFTNSNTAANPTLNVNSTGAKAIMKYGTTAAGTTVADSWPAGAVVEFVYDGTNWIMEDDKSDAFVPKTGGTFNGHVTINRADGTTSAQGYSSMTLGNNKASGTAQNSKGQILLFGNGTNYVNVHPNDLTTDRTFVFPDFSGTSVVDTSFNAFTTIKTTNESDFNAMYNTANGRIMYGIINNALYISFDVMWIRLQFRVTNSSTLQSRVIYGQTTAEAWKTITRS